MSQPGSIQGQLNQAEAENAKLRELLRVTEHQLRRAVGILRDVHKSTACIAGFLGDLP